MGELIDQTGFIFRMSAADAIRWNGLLIKARDCRLIVNDDFWKGVVYVEAKECVDSSLGDPSSWRPIGAQGRVVIRAYGKDDSPMDPVAVLRRIEALHADSTVAIVLEHPDTGVALRRVSFAGCRWGPPEIHFENRPSRKPLATISVDFKADRYSDDVVTPV